MRIAILLPRLLTVAVVVLISCGIAHAQTAREWLAQRSLMVDEDIVKAGVKNQKVIRAMWGTPRHEFVPADQRKLSYYDMSLPIGDHQTISAPFVVAKMTESVDPQPGDKVLEIGTGSGYQAAVLSGIVKEVYTIEIVESLGERAASTLKKLGFKNVHAKVGDGYLGWEEHAPFDKIIVTCSPEKIPAPLVAQLREGGRMVIPLGERYQQTLYLMKKTGGKLVTEALEPTFFVPMTGRADSLRKSDTDDVFSGLVNGDFEDSSKGQPNGWYYVRQGSVKPSDRDDSAGHCLAFSNEVPGHACQALQAIGIDGSQVAELDVSLWVKTKNIHQGVVAEQQPRLVINFFDENRVPVGQQIVGPWSRDESWTQKVGRVKVPRSARTAIVGVGLVGATGQLSVDDVELGPALPSTTASVSQASSNR